MARLEHLPPAPQTVLFADQLGAPALKLTRHRARWQSSMLEVVAPFLVIALIFLTVGFFTNGLLPVAIFLGVVSIPSGFLLLHAHRQESPKSFQLKIQDQRFLFGDQDLPLDESLLLVDCYQASEHKTHFEVSVVVGLKRHTVGTWANQAKMVPALLAWARRHGLKAARRNLKPVPTEAPGCEGLGELVLEATVELLAE